MKDYIKVTEEAIKNKKYKQYKNILSKKLQELKKVEQNNNEMIKQLCND